VIRTGKQAAITAFLGLALTAPVLAGALSLHSSAFTAGAAIPKRFSCQGAGISPPLSWSGVPAQAKSLALIVADPDAPSGTWTHWVVYNLAPSVHALLANAGSKGLPGNAATGRNSYHHDDYGGVCPPSGTHHYHFQLYALDTRLPTQDYNRQALKQAMRGHVIARGTLVGTYKKQ
jgi:Raf kinase inhibitor-like YbhB/YbcL family protein